MTEAARVGEIARLSVPTVLVAFGGAAAQTLEVWLIGRLGTEALAGYALVLPLLMLLQMTSTGAMGGGVASAIARALGAGRRDEASALVMHSMLIALGMGLAFTIGVLGAGEALFRAMGARGATLDYALTYSSWLFAGAVLVWLANTLGAVLRGTGNMRLPAMVMLAWWAIEAPLSGVLMLVFDMGLRGAAIAYITAFAGCCITMIVALMRGAAGFVPRFDVEIRRALFGRILSVGAVATLMATIANITVVLVTALVARHGDAAIAAYGVGVRLEFLMVPLAYGIGATMTAMVGHRVGAGAWGAARATAWRGGLLAGAIALAIGIAAAALPGPLARTFGTSQAVQDSIRLYLVIVGPAFGVFGLGMALYFAAQGAGRMRGPFTASVARIVVSVGGGVLLGDFFGWGLPGLFAAVSAGFVAYGVIMAASVRAGVWR